MRIMTYCKNSTRPIDEDHLIIYTADRVEAVNIHWIASTHSNENVDQGTWGRTRAVVRMPVP